MHLDVVFPEPPVFSDEKVEGCRASGDFRPILFEWYKYVGIIASLVSSIQRTSPAARIVPTLHYGALIGLLNRCSRLMLANVRLSHKGLFGEATVLIDRCVFETAVKVRWLCSKNSDDAFRRFVADGLKTELALKAEIQGNISARGGQLQQIEDRMLRSIERYIASSGMTDDEIAASKKLPDLASMIDQLGNSRLLYVVGQKIGSHHIHGTWPSLLQHYLRWDDEGPYPRDHDCPTDANQFVFVPLMVLSALAAFCSWLIEQPTDLSPVLDLMQSIEHEILRLNRLASGSDFEVTQTQDRRSEGVAF